MASLKKAETVEPVPVAVKQDLDNDADLSGNESLGFVEEEIPDQMDVIESPQKGTENNRKLLESSQNAFKEEALDESDQFVIGLLN